MILRFGLTTLLITLFLTACSNPANPVNSSQPPQPNQSITSSPNLSWDSSPTTSQLTSDTPKLNQSETSQAVVPVPLEITSVTPAVKQGEIATVSAQTVPGASCNIVVYYKTGHSSASGLERKVADGNGNVSWTWKVGVNTTPGSYKIVVTTSANGQTVTRDAYFTVQ